MDKSTDCLTEYVWDKRKFAYLRKLNSAAYLQQHCASVGDATISVLWSGMLKKCCIVWYTSGITVNFQISVIFWKVNSNYT